MYNSSAWLQMQLEEENNEAVQGHTDEAELLKVLEKDAEAFENDFFKAFYEETPVFDFHLPGVKQI